MLCISFHNWTCRGELAEPSSDVGCISDLWNSLRLWAELDFHGLPEPTQCSVSGMRSLCWTFACLSTALGCTPSEKKLQSQRCYRKQTAATMMGTVTMSDTLLDAKSMSNCYFLCMSCNNIATIQMPQNIIQYWSLDEKAIVLHLAFIIHGHSSPMICGLTS